MLVITIVSFVFSVFFIVLALVKRQQLGAVNSALRRSDAATDGLHRHRLLIRREVLQDSLHACIAYGVTFTVMCAAVLSTYALI